jgi:protocatechuate 3,4-dioxygenase beta subunit
MFLIVLINLLISSFCLTSFAKSPETVLEDHNKIPPTINYYPYSDFSFTDERIEWQTYNNLRRKQGSAFFAIGEKLFVEGYVKDINGIPIDGIVVKLVQSNANGVYNHMAEKEDALYDSNFASNGISITDNRGYYSFITVFPGYYNNRAPHLHIKLESLKHGIIETEIFFENHPRNAMDPKYTKLTKQEQKLLTGQTSFIDPRQKEQGKKVRFDLTYNANQTTKVF